MATRAEHYLAAERNLLDASREPGAGGPLEQFLIQAALVHAVLATASEDTEGGAWKLAHPPGARKGDGNAGD